MARTTSVSNIPKNWTTSSLSDVCEIEKITNTNQLLPFIGLENIQSNTGTLLNKEDGTKIKSNTFYFNKSHVLYGRLRAYLNKTIVPNFEGQCSTEIFPLKPTKNLDRKFLFYWLLNPQNAEQIDKTSTGARMPRANMNHVMEFEIALPPLKEQKEIVKILDSAFERLDHSLENCKQALTLTKELWQSSLDRALSHREGWTTSSLSDVCENTENRNPMKNPDSYFLYADVSSIDNTKMEITNYSKLLGAEAPSRARKVIRKNDIIFATVRPTLKRIAMINDVLDNQICSTGYVVLRTNKIESKLIFYYLQTATFINQMNILQKGASYPAVSDTEVKQQIITFPSSIEEQKEIVTKLDKINDFIKKLEYDYTNKILYIKELKSSLLNDAFTGKLTNKE